MIPNINFNLISSDPLLMAALGLLILGPLVFLIALVKFLRSGKSKNAIPLIIDQEQEMAPVVAPPHAQEFKHEEQQRPSEQMPATSGGGEIQEQLEIVFSQLKNLSKKVDQFESELESVSRTASAKLESNELKELPMNPADFTQKLLKLAEHVIILEKDMARLKSGAKQSSEPLPSAPKPPIMPI